MHIIYTGAVKENKAFCLADFILHSEFEPDRQDCSSCTLKNV